MVARVAFDLLRQNWDSSRGAAPGAFHRRGIRMTQAFPLVTVQPPRNREMARSWKCPVRIH